MLLHVKQAKQTDNPIIKEIDSRKKKHSALLPKQPKNWCQDIAQLGMYTTFLLRISGLEFPEINSQYLIHTIIDQMCLGIPK